ncbi:MAG: ComEC/Rec2 family competence protein [Bacteroidota bacterium]
MKNLALAPLLKLLLPFMLGICLASYFAWPPLWWLAPGLCLYLMTALADYFWGSWHTEHLVAGVNLLFFLSLGAAWYSLYQARPQAPVLSSNKSGQVSLVGKVHTSPAFTPYGGKLQLSLYAMWEDGTWIEKQGLVQVYLDSAAVNLVEPGDSLYCGGWLKPFIPKDSGYAAYLTRIGMHHKLRAQVYRPGGKVASLDGFFQGLQLHLSHQLEGFMENKAYAGIAQAMLLGDKHALDRDIRQDFTDTGLSHLLAISGLHVGIIFMFLQFLFSPLHLLPHGMRWKNLLILGILLGFMLLTGAKPAVSRAVLLFGTVLVLKAFYLPYQSLNILAFTAFLQLAWNPLRLFELGFQMSYAAVFAILLGLPLLEKWLRTGSPLLDAILGSLVVSLFATLGTLPWVLIHFGQFPTYFLVANLATTLIAWASVLVGFLCIMFCWLPWFNQLLASFLELCLSSLSYVAGEVASWPFAVIEQLDIQAPGLWILIAQLLMVAGLFLLPAWLRQHRWRFQREESYVARPVFQL